MKNFSSYIKKLNKAKNRNNHLRSLLIGRNDKAWMIIYCEDSGHYYAMSMASGNAIMSGTSAIRPAFLIDPKTGKPEKNPTDINGVPTLPHLGKGPRLFAVKIFSGNKSVNKNNAENELNALSEHHSAEASLSPDGQPLIISDFYPGQTLCDASGKPNTALLAGLSIEDRFTLILQIANQYFEIHRHKSNKSAWIHTDVKGSNIIIYAAGEGPKNAWVIDFGSAKKLLTDSVDETAATSLNGLTQNMIPKEAISTSHHRYVSLNDETGHVSRQSDVYALAPVFATLLGATDPYINRRRDIRTQHGFDLQELVYQIKAGFDFQGLLSDDRCKIPGKLHSGHSATAFINRIEMEAPNSKTILEDKTVPDVCCILYRDQLLHVDKSRNKITNRKVTKPSQFKNEIAHIKQIKSTDKLNKKDFFEVNKLLNVGAEGHQSLDDLLRPLVISFLNHMIADHPADRPSIEEVLRFFTTVNNVIWLAAEKNTEITAIERERLILIGLLQLNIIAQKGWSIKLPIHGLKGERRQRKYTTFAEFDFNLLVDDPIIFEKIGKVFLNRELSGTNEPLSRDDFAFCLFASENKKIYDAIILKFSDDNLKKSSRNNIRKIILRLGPDKASQLLSLPKQMILSIITDRKSTFIPDLQAVDAFIRCGEFLQHHFPEAYTAIKDKIEPLQKHFPGSTTVEALDSKALFALLNQVRSAKNEFACINTYNNLIKLITSALCYEITYYLSHIDQLDHNEHLRFSMFNKSHHTIGEIRQAALTLIEAIQSGDFADLLNNGKVLTILKSKALDKISKPLINELIDQANHHQPKPSMRGQYV